MKLSFAQIAGASRGVASVEANGKWVRFHRFTVREEEIYRDLHLDKCNKLLATAGVRVAFCTDSESFSFAFRFFDQCSSRQIPRIDVYVNGAMVAHVGLDDYIDRAGRSTVALGKGNKTVELYLPWAMGCEVADLILDDGASFEPLHRTYTMISYGDSITHGYDSKYPSLSYAATLARLMDADSVNKGIGGETFFPELLEGADKTVPDFVTVAYGTNDWAHQPREMIQERCRAFYAKLSACYPASKIFAIAPIWRGNSESCDTEFGAPLNEVYTLMCEQTADLENVTVIPGDGLFPHVKAFTTDALHPNDAGAQIYAQNLYRAIEAYLQ